MWITCDILMKSDSQEIEIVYLINCTIYNNTKVSILGGCLKNIRNLDFSTLSTSIFDFNHVVIFDISVFILFSMFMFFLQLPKVSSVDIIIINNNISGLYTTYLGL